MSEEWGKVRKTVTGKCWVKIRGNKWEMRNRKEEWGNTEDRNKKKTGKMRETNKMR